MFNSFAAQVQVDEFDGPTQADWDEYHEWAAEHDTPTPQPTLFVTDCDYCGDISLCFEDNYKGTCCVSCGDPETGEPCPDEDEDRPACHPIFDGKWE